MWGEAYSCKSTTIKCLDNQTYWHPPPPNTHSARTMPALCLAAPCPHHQLDQPGHAMHEPPAIHRCCANPSDVGVSVLHDGAQPAQLAVNDILTLAGSRAGGCNRSLDMTLPLGPPLPSPTTITTPPTPCYTHPLPYTVPCCPCPHHQPCQPPHPMHLPPAPGAVQTSPMLGLTNR